MQSKIKRRSWKSSYSLFSRETAVPRAMKNILNRLNGPPRLMIVSDLDHTMVDHQENQNNSLLRFNSLWESLYRQDSVLVFSTGRSPSLYQHLRREKPLLTPDILITSVGAEITYVDSREPDDGWENLLDEKWDERIVIEETNKFQQLIRQVETEQRPHKISFYIDKLQAKEVIIYLSHSLKNRGLDVKIIYSGGNDLDILPRGAGKGQALAYLLKEMKAVGKSPLNTLVCGDSGNDIELFNVPDVYGVMVSNAREELLSWHAENAKDNPKIMLASERCAAGIMQAIDHFGLGQAGSLRQEVDLLSCKPCGVSPAYELVKLYLMYERWRRDDIKEHESLIKHLKDISNPAGTFIHQSGAKYSFEKAIEVSRLCYGDKEGKNFRVWLDTVSTSTICSECLVVTFVKSELADGVRQCCRTSVVLKSQPAIPGGFIVEHIQETCLSRCASEDQ